ncbi:MAG: phage holin family protein, partial [Caldilineaceae bacterium]|nr:phage holin family protein [Caldilineaceae bacterium]
MPTQPVDNATAADRAATRRTDAVAPTFDDHRDESLGMLFADLSDQVSTLMRREVELAKVETQETISAATGAAVSIISGGVIAYAGLIIVLQAIALV